MIKLTLSAQKPQRYCLKGGSNLRFFFKSIRYSEDMDLDAVSIAKDALLEAVMAILNSLSFQKSLKSLGIEAIKVLDISKAKQTETIQRFKVHVISSSGEDLFTKVEFSRRGTKGQSRVEPVLDSVLRPYLLAPLLVPHYTLGAMIEQKAHALISRKVPQARDIFDLYLLSSQYNPEQASELKLALVSAAKAEQRIFEIDFREFRDNVIAYLSAQDQGVYNNSQVWDEVRLKVIDFLGELNRQG